MKPLPPAEVELRGVSVRYGSRVVVDRVDLQAPGATITALVGPSGSGKTSVLHAINRLHALDPNTHVDGDVRIGGEDAATLDDYTLRTRVGLLFQRPTPFPMSIRENISFPLRCHGIARAELDDRVREALIRGALWAEVRDRLDASASSLSGGQQQRLCLARALALHPRVLLLDEPCSALDPRSTAQIEDTLRGLAGTTTMLLVTHNLAQARRVASTCVCLWPSAKGGHVVDSGPIERVFGAPATAELADYVRGIIG